MQPRSSKRPLQFGPIGAPAAFDLCELPNDPPLATVQVMRNRFTLRGDAQA
jgi:hypothetical protein